jgi:hypothetical protein
VREGTGFYKIATTPEGRYCYDRFLCQVIFVPKGKRRETWSATATTFHEAMRELFKREGAKLEVVVRMTDERGYLL